jgi:NAD(P)-dependent dehydrogenase (short-subunit alcohol dehydrogenase family)
MKLKGKVAIVTGSSRGIGAAIARRYGREGAKVAVTAREKRDRAEAVVAEIEAGGGTAKSFLADIVRVEECERLAQEVIAHFGTVDILVNNAGIFLANPIEEVTEELWDAHQNVNLKGPFFLTKAVVPTMKAKGAGKIINISSVAGIGGFPQSSAYCASKGGLTNLSRALCLELASAGINVNTLSPGNLVTDMNASLRAQEGYDAQQAALTPAGIGHMDPDEMAGTAVYLASSDANSVHGADLLVDNGWAAR